MKLLVSIFILTGLLACNNTAPQKGAPVKTDSVATTHAIYQPATLFTQEDAEKIMGEPAHLKEQSNNVTTNGSSYMSAYEAKAKSTNGRTGVIYFLINEYKVADSAHSEYVSIMEANRKNGIEELHGVGDEAYFHTDHEGFYFIMARKGNKEFRLKVNKITPTTSLDAFNEVGRKIAKAL